MLVFMGFYSVVFLQTLCWFIDSKVVTVSRYEVHVWRIFFLKFNLLLQNHWANFNQTWHMQLGWREFKLLQVKDHFWISSMYFHYVVIIIPHATRCGGYYVFDPSISQSVSQSCFSCQHNSSETAQQNIVKLCSYEGHNV